MPITKAQAFALLHRVGKFEEAVRNHELIGAQTVETADEFEKDYQAESANLKNYIHRLTIKPKKDKKK